MSQSGFFDRVRRARIVQVLLVYVGASWVVLQVTSTLQQSMQLPEWLSPVAVLLLLVGLVIVLATAWVQSRPVAPTEPAEAGAQHAAADRSVVPGKWELGASELKAAVMRGELPHLTWARSLLGGVLAFSLLFGVTGLYVVVKDRGRTLGPAGLEAAVAPGVAVVPFTVTGAGLDSWREGMVDLLSTSLDGAGGMRAIDSRTVMARWRERVGGEVAPDLSTALEAARATGAAYAVVGNAVSLGTRVRLAARVYDLGNGSELGPAQIEGNADSVFALVDGLSAGVIQRMLAGQVPSLRRLAEVTTTSLPALKAFLEGEALFRHSDFTGAIAAYERGIEADTGFALALSHAGHAYGWAESVGSDRAGEYAARAVRHASRLSDREALVARAQVAEFGANAAMIDTLRIAVRRYPDDPELWYTLGDMIEHLGAERLVDPVEGLNALKQAVALDPGFAPYRIHVVEHAIRSLDRAAAQRELAGYDSSADRGVNWHGLHLAFDLVFADSAARAAEVAALDTVGFQTLRDADLALWGITTYRAMSDVLSESASRPEAEPGTVVRLHFALANQGRFRELLRLLDHPALIRGPRQVIALTAHRAGIDAPELDRALAPSADTSATPAWWGIGLYAADRGRWRDHAAAVTALHAAETRSLESGDSAAADMYADLVTSLGAYGAWRRGGRAADAARALGGVQARHVGYAGTATRNEVLRWMTAEAYAAAGQEDTALRYLRSLPDDALAHLRMAQLFMRTEQPDSARAHLGIFLEAWQHADPDLPQLAEARQMLERLGGDKPR